MAEGLDPTPENVERMRQRILEQGERAAVDRATD
jgi:hypothetical protein